MKINGVKYILVEMIAQGVNDSGMIKKAVNDFGLIYKKAKTGERGFIFTKTWAIFEFWCPVDKAKAFTDYIVNN